MCRYDIREYRRGGGGVFSRQNSMRRTESNTLPSFMFNPTYDNVESNNFIVTAPVGDMNVSVNNDDVEIEAPTPTYDIKELNYEDTVGVKSSVGNPHFMIEVSDVDNTDLEGLNSKLIASDNFPDGVNIEIYQLISNNYVKARVFERGVGETDACGSGALCIFNYLYKTNKLENNSYVMYPGGDLNLRYENDKLILSGEVIYL